MVSIFDFVFDLSKIQASRIELFKLFENYYFTFTFNPMDDYLKQTCLDLDSNNEQLRRVHSEQLEYFSEKSVYQHFAL